MMAKLTKKQDAFVKEYLLNGGNGNQAAIKAGYSEDTARIIAAENLTKPNIKAAIELHQSKANKTFIKSKEDKLKILEEVMKACKSSDEEKGMLNANAVIAAIKEHNLMQGDNAPTQIENKHITDSGENVW